MNTIFFVGIPSLISIALRKLPHTHVFFWTVTSGHEAIWNLVFFFLKLYILQNPTQNLNSSMCRRLQAFLQKSPIYSIRNAGVKGQTIRASSDHKMSLLLLSYHIKKTVGNKKLSDCIHSVLMKWLENLQGAFFVTSSNTKHEFLLTSL